MAAMNYKPFPQVSGKLKSVLKEIVDSPHFDETQGRWAALDLLNGEMPWCRTRRRSLYDVLLALTGDEELTDELMEEVVIRR